MIRAIIFDCYGVLTSDGWLPFKKHYFSHDPELLKEATDLSKQKNAGMITEREFVERVAALSKVSKTDILEAVTSSVPDYDLFAYIREELSGTCKIGMLSNAGSNMLAHLFDTSQIDLFDEIALSFETGFVKPSRNAYVDIAARMGVEPEECVFVDDQPRFCSAAQTTGMQAIVYQDFEQFRTELQHILA